LLAIFALWGFVWGEFGVKWGFYASKLNRELNFIIL